MRKKFHRLIPATAIGALIVAVPVVASAAAAPSAGHAATATGAHSTSAQAPQNLRPQVVHTGTAPTGYEVTFRFYDPAAQQVQIKGEWYFANPLHFSRLSGTSTTDIVSSPGLTPAQWKPGDVPLAHPNSTAANWPVVSMTRGSNGVWTYTTPLPSGAFSYGFFVNCTSSTQTGCLEVADPANPPYNIHGGVATGSTEPVSQVYVPSDPAFDTQDYSYQAPNPTGGTLTDVTYPAPSSTTPAGSNYLTVYTPPGYDPRGKQAYPTVYVFAPDDEVAWSSQGALKNTLDNLIDQGQIKPMVMVSANVKGFPTSTDSSVIDADITQHVIPYVQAHYNVSKAASDRAIASIGNEGGIVNSMLFEHTGEFGYYGAFGFSEGEAYTLPTADQLTPTKLAALKKVSIMLGGGYEDPHHWYHEAELALLNAAGVAVTPDFVLSGHDWYSWRINAKDFLTRAAFFPLPGAAPTARG